MENKTSVMDVIGETQKQIKTIDPSTAPSRYTFDDLGIGYLFTDSFKNVIRYASDIGRWMYYNGCVWKEDIGSIAAKKCAKTLYEYLKSKYPSEPFAAELSKRSKRETIIKEAQDVSPIITNELDKNPLLLNCRNGTIDLSTDKFKEHNSDDFLSKVANVTFDPNAKSERFERFINEIMCSDNELALYLQKTLGYGLSGDISEECLFIFYGATTRNGKGTLMESVLNLLGDYSRTIQPDSLAQRKLNAGGSSADIARLAGVRLVNASELPSGMKLNAAIVKQLTGGDTVTARLLYKNFFEFKPQFKIFINTNHLPEIDDDTLFASRRLRLIPFDKHFDEKTQDNHLKTLFKEETEKSAILNWLLDGYKRYKKEGLHSPNRASELLHEYRQNSDAVGLYIQMCLESCDTTIPKERTKTQDFYCDFIGWCKNQNVAEITLKGFVDSLRQKNILERDRQIGHFIKSYKIKHKEKGEIQ